MNKVKIIRKTKMNGNFMQIDYDLLWNHSLSSNEKIIMFTVLSYKDGCSFTKSIIQEKTNIPSSTFDREWHNLIQKGYIKSEHLGNRNWNITFYEESKGPILRPLLWPHIGDV